jgi:hypothetical protein
VIIDIDPAAGVVTKQAQTPADVARLRKEALILNQARHPGVVELIGVKHPGELRFRAIDSCCVADCLVDGAQRWTMAELVAFGAEAATTVADLHDIGVVHGELSAHHVLIDSDRRPVLCSLGHQAEGPEDDVAALGQLLRQLQAGVVAPGEPGASGDFDQIVRSATHPDPGRRPTARALARRLAEPTGPHRLGVTRRPGLAAAGILIMVAAAAFWLRPGSAAPVAGFHVNEAADPVAVGRWTCRNLLPALLRPAAGEVWVWNDWPRGRRPVPGRLVSRVAGATSIRAVTARPGCDSLLITRRTGLPIAIDPLSHS